MSDIITCTKTPKAIVPDASKGVYERYNLVDGLELDERDTPDGAPILVDAGCGRDVRVPTAIWDVSTDDDGNVVERHLAVPCPNCGRTADHLSEPVEKISGEDYYRQERDGTLRRHFGKRFDEAWHEDMRDLLYRGSWDLIDGKLHPVVRGGSDTGYANFTEGAVALVGAAAKSVIGLKNHANFGSLPHHYEVAFDGVTASAVPVLIEFLFSSWATNGPGTNSTSTTIRQEFGRVTAAGSTAGKNWTAEPTTLTQVAAEFLLTPNGGTVIYDWPLGKEPDSGVNEGFAIRCNAPAAVNVRATLKWRRA